ncbi:outer membrane protein assembly factor BamB family protein [Streptomyces halstedii]|uniref:outer membrane protein assembly factor BamB family protein n=1 Tax=Streptomyces halstedii TaxID=1944 RepID=UPI0038126FCD
MTEVLGGSRGRCAAASPDGSRVYIGGGDSALHAIAPRGRKLWATNLHEQVMSPLATADGVYCLLQGEGDGASKLCALAPDGTVRWSKPIDEGASQFLVPACELVLVTTGDTAKGAVRAYAPDGTELPAMPAAAASVGKPTKCGSRGDGMSGSGTLPL